MKTLEHVRDEIANMMGWELRDESDHNDNKDFPPGMVVWKKKGSGWSECHPTPTTLDGIAALMPEGWKWERFQLADGNMVLEATRFSDRFKVNRLEGFDSGVRLTVEDFTIFLHAVLTSTKGAEHE